MGYGGAGGWERENSGISCRVYVRPGCRGGESEAPFTYLAFYECKSVLKASISVDILLFKGIITMCAP